MTHPGSIQRPLADPPLQRSIALMTKRGRPHPAGGREFHARRARIAGWAEISRPSSLNVMRSAVTPSPLVGEGWGGGIAGHSQIKGLFFKWISRRDPPP